MRVASEFKFTINLGQGKDNPYLILDKPTDEQTCKFLAGRAVLVGKEIINKTIEAKAELVNELLTGCGKIEIEVMGKWVALTPKIPDWKTHIPVNWKVSVGYIFEEREVFSEADEKK